MLKHHTSHAIAVTSDGISDANECGNESVCVLKHHTSHAIAVTSDGISDANECGNESVVC